MTRTSLGAVALTVLALMLAGCREPGGQDKPEAPRVSVSAPVSKQVREYEYAQGRVAAKEDVEVRARVSGYLDKVFFQEGKEVEAGAPLFEIDRAPFQAEVDRSTAELQRTKATMQTAKSEMDRQKFLLAKDATSRSDYDVAIGKLGEATAIVQSAQASLEQARINLGYTLIKSRISGRASKMNITPGNLVSADKTLLTTVVSVDPMYAYFAVDENTVQRIQQLIVAGKIKATNETTMAVELALPGETGYPHKGLINFVDNQIDANTGTLRVRGEFPNPDRLMTAGNYCKVRVALGAPHSALMVPERALQSDQGQKYLLVVDKDNLVQRQPVEVGQLVDGLRVIADGLKGGEKVIIDGVQRVRPGVTVDPRPSVIQPEPGRTTDPATGKGEQQEKAHR
jgi:RND family efflux transporter MFP subunit